MKNDWLESLKTLALEAWAETVEISARKIALAILAAGLTLTLLLVVVVGHSLMSGLAHGIGLAIGITAVAFLLAPLTALVGWLFRGTYNMRPLLCALLLTMFVALFCNQVFLPLAFLPTIGMLFKILIPLLTLVSGAIGAAASFMTMFPHRFLRFGVALALVSGVSGAYTQFQKDIRPGRAAFMAKVFSEDQPTLAKILDTGRRPARAITDDFRALETEFGQGH